MPRISLRDITRNYGGPVPVSALRGISLQVRQGEFIAIQGPSGGGKSSLLNIIGLLDLPTSGRYALGDTEVGQQTQTQSSKTRSDNIAFIFQNFHLLDRRKVSDSVELGLVYRAVSKSERNQRVAESLAAVGLGGLAEQKANTLSGGQRQRVAIARALASGAPIVVADEPTGNLDTQNSELVLANLRHVQSLGATVVMVTHSPELAAMADRRFHLVDGLLTEIGAHDGDEVATIVTPPKVLGRASTVRIVDTVRDGLRSLSSRVPRTIALVCAVALGVGLAVATAGISFSAAAQVSDTFDAHLNRDVTISWKSGALNTEPAQVRGSILHRLDSVRGVDAAGILQTFDSQEIQVDLVRPTFDAPMFGMTESLPKAGQLKVHWATSHSSKLAPDELLVGSSLAAQLDLADVNLRPTLAIDGRTMVVVGIINESPRVPQILGAVLLPTTAAKAFGAATNSQALIWTKAGAAQQVARQEPLVIDPYAPKSLGVSAPTDPATLRNQVEGSVQVTLLIVTAVALLGSIAGLANAMSLAIAERKQEIGLRRALGALPRHIAGLIFIESAIVGVLGGVLGLAIGLIAILGTTIGQRWIPVFDLRLAPAAIIGGIIVGTLGGIIASARASRVQPTEALRL
jgi:macrolide transport system ATP-binding/permease protein